MIEIRPAKPDELLRQKELWKLAFGDEDDYIDYFFAHGEESQVLVLLEDGVVYTMVALFPVAIALPGGRKASSARTPEKRALADTSSAMWTFI